jgi:hypothetical protein
MTDGDIVHSQLSWPYQRPYRWLCEGKANSDECAWMVMGAIMREIKKKGAAPVVLAKRMGESLRQGIDNGVRNWAALSEELDRQARQAPCPHYEKQLVLRASKGILHDFRYGRRMDTSWLPEVAVERYFQELYRWKFKERIPLTSKHHAGIDSATVMKRVEALSPNLFPVFRKWAKQANADEDVASLRRPRRQKVKEIDLNEDLL